MRRRKVKIALTVLLCVVMAVCGMYLLELFVIQPSLSASDTEELRNLLSQTQPPTTQSAASAPETSSNPQPTFSEQLAALQAVCPDIKGWLKIDGTQIDYPVLQSSASDPDYYLHRSYKGEYRDAGSLYLQYDCTPLESMCSIIYGHHMRDDSMFGTLPGYDNLSYLKAHPSFTYGDETGWHTYDIFAVIETTTAYKFNRTTFADTADYAAYLKDLQSKSLYETGVPVSENDRIMLLATCSYARSNGRTIVCGVKR